MRTPRCDRRHRRRLLPPLLLLCHLLLALLGLLAPAPVGAGKKATGKKQRSKTQKRLLKTPMVRSMRDGCSDEVEACIAIDSCMQELLRAAEGREPPSSGSDELMAVKVCGDGLAEVRQREAERELEELDAAHPDFTAAMKFYSQRVRAADEKAKQSQDDADIMESVLLALESVEQINALPPLDQVDKVFHGYFDDLHARFAKMEDSLREVMPKLGVGEVRAQWQLRHGASRSLPTLSPPPAPPDPEQQRQELRQLKKSQLHKRAAKAGVGQETLDSAHDADDPKEALVELVMRTLRPDWVPEVAVESEQQPRFSGGETEEEFTARMMDRISREKGMEL